MAENLMCPYCFHYVEKALLDRNIYCSYDAQAKRFIHTWNPDKIAGKSLLISPQYLHSTKERNVRVISFTGAASQGKTVYIQTLSSILQKRDQGSYVNGFPKSKYQVYCTPLHTESDLSHHPFFTPYDLYWKKGIVPLGTNPRERPPSLIVKFHLKHVKPGFWKQLTGAYNTDVVCIFNDIAGEPAQKAETWVLRGDLVPHCKRTTDTFLIADASLSDDKLAAFLNRLLSAYTAVGTRTRNQNLVIILTKIDLLPTDHPVRHICLTNPFLFENENFDKYRIGVDMVNKKLETYFGETFTNAYNLMKDNFRQLFFTGTSSMGSAPLMVNKEMRVSFDIQPIRVIDPLLFVLSEANHF